ncbi:hypothetical protein Tco_0308876 [Tanacetum coccineum]
MTLDERKKQENKDAERLDPTWFIRHKYTVGMVRGKTNQIRPYEHVEQWMNNKISFPSIPGWRTGLRSLGAVASTIHLMIKFPTDNGTATMMTKRETLQEYWRMEEGKGPVLEIRITHPHIQAFEPEETTTKEKEEIQEQSNKQEETTQSGLSPSSCPGREVIRDKKDKEKDKLPKAPN